MRAVASNFIVCEFFHGCVVGCCRAVLAECSVVRAYFECARIVSDIGEVCNEWRVCFCFEDVWCGVVEAEQEFL